MNCYLLVHQKVKEYSDWRIEFDSNKEWRRKHGERRIQIFRDENTPATVVLLIEFESADSAKKFIADPTFSEQMQISGVLEQPTIDLLIKD